MVNALRVDIDQLVRAGSGSLLEPDRQVGAPPPPTGGGRALVNRVPFPGLGRSASIPCALRAQLSTTLFPRQPLRLVHLVTRRLDQLARHSSERKAHVGNCVFARAYRDHEI